LIARRRGCRISWVPSLLCRIRAGAVARCICCCVGGRVNTLTRVRLVSDWTVLRGRVRSSVSLICRRDCWAVGGIHLSRLVSEIAGWVAGDIACWIGMRSLARRIPIRAIRLVCTRARISNITRSSVCTVLRVARLCCRIVHSGVRSYL
jgi:hypothetical protein